MIQKLDDAKPTLTSLPWKEVLELVESEQLTAIPTETLEFAVEENNYQFLVESALKSLETSDPEKANLEYAAKLADKMKEIASRVLAERIQTNQ